jgi:RNA polymerase sigma-70 factor (ECF subfamily)
MRVLALESEGAVVEKYQRAIDQSAVGFIVTTEKMDQIFRRYLDQVSRLMLADFPAVRRWEQTEDVAHRAAIRLMTTLKKVRVKSELHLERLVAQQVRWTLLTLAEQLSHSVRSLHITPGVGVPELNSVVDPCSVRGDSAGDLIIWMELQRQIDLLPAKEKDVLELIWYGGLTRAQVADQLQETVRNVQRRYRAARERLGRRLCGGG